ncbi:MAG: hypothetical protein Q8M23_01700 [Bacteroidales bacterium]|nr:hypothetical protein [Bacteroidales bacterium]
MILFALANINQFIIPLALLPARSAGICKAGGPAIPVAVERERERERERAEP